MTLTYAQRRAVARRSVGFLDDGRRACLKRPGDTEEMARAVFAAYEPDLQLEGPVWVDWCCHTADYAFRNNCGDWCANPSPRMVWTASYITEAVT